MQNQITSPPLIRRSKLVVSPLSGDAVKNGAGSGADALIVDLTRTVFGGSEAEMYAGAKKAIAGLSSTGSDLFLWVSPQETGRALAACWVPQLAGVVVSADSPEEVKAVDAALAAWEREKSLPGGQLQIDLAIASGRAVMDMHDLAAASSRVVSLTLDEDSLLAELKVERSLDVDQLLYPRGRAIIVARLFEVQAHSLGFVLGEISPLAMATMGRKIGLRGALCFDPADVPALNQGFRPADSETEHAHTVIEVMDEAVKNGLGSTKLPGGAMVDMAMFKHSQSLLQWDAAIREKESTKTKGSGKAK